MINKLKKKIQSIKFLAQEKGSVAIEFALSLPIWVLLLLGSSDIAYMMLLSQRVDRITFSVTDIITQSETLTIADLNNTLLAASELMKPFEFTTRGVVIVSSIYKPSGGATTITWQHTGGGSLARSSKIGAVNGTPALPNGMTINNNENVIVAEVYYDFHPMFMDAGILSTGDIYRVTVFKPRLSPLMTPPL